jgi:hypothetical protein
LVAWTVLVWTGRIRNVIGDGDLSPAGRISGLAVAAVFLGLAGLSVSVLLGGRGGVGTTRFVAVFCLWTITFWAVRGTGMLFADHDLGFKAVHSVLALVSIGLAVPLHRLDRDLGQSRSGDPGAEHSGGPEGR